MPKYLHPGVYIEEISAVSRHIEAVATSVTAFIGNHPKGIGREPKLFRSQAEYEAAFGPVVSGSDAMGIALSRYFMNGGEAACVCHLPVRATALHFRKFFQTGLSKVEDVCIIVLPGRVWDEHGRSCIEEAVAHCEAMGDRMLILDLPDAELKTESDVADLSLPSSDRAVCYYPWINMTNPVQPGTTISVPPSAFAAGVWAGTDSRRGVWKAPAGLEVGDSVLIYRPLFGIFDKTLKATTGTTHNLRHQRTDRPCEHHVV